MKLTKILYVVALAATIVGCKKSEIPTYNDLTDTRFVYFETKSSSTKEISFSDYQSAEFINFPIVVVATGWSDKDMEYKITIDPEKTTAEPSDYTLPEKIIFRAGRAIDTLYVKLNYSKKLDEEKVAVTFNITPNENFQCGPALYLSYNLIFHANIKKPDWWGNAQTYYLGTYSVAKYKAFMPFIEDPTSMSDQLLHQGAWSDYNAPTYSLLNLYTRRFKKYLDEMAAKGTPLLEENGDPITLTIR